MRGYKPIKELPKYQHNPFLENAIQKVEENTVSKRRFIKGGKGVEQSIVNDHGEITGTTAFLQQIEVDEDKFAKLYLSQFSAFWDLSKPAIKVFGHIITNCLIPNKDEFYFNMDEALEYTRYTSNRYILTGLASLCEHDIIARSNMAYKYFINPLVVFNGNRVTFAKTYIRKKKKTIEDKNQMSIPGFEGSEFE
jgi:hypothetical protein